MPITTLSSRQFNQDASRAMVAAQAGPVIITDRGRPSHVLLTYSDYKKLVEGRANIADLLALPEQGDLDQALTPSRELPRPAELS